ncbi:MAG: hypothetical protein ACKOFB_00070 [bacterium]
MNAKEQAVLFELISRSKGLGDSVAVYPFESVLKGLFDQMVDAKLTIFGLQKKGFIKIDEKAGFDEFRKRPSLYPVYIITTKGWEYALKARGEELKIKEKIEQESLDDIELPDFLSEDDSDELDD